MENKSLFWHFCTIFASIISILVLNGCVAVQGYKNTLNDFETSLKSNKCDYTIIDQKIKDDNDTILWGLQGGSLARNCKNYKKSISFFDKVEKKYKIDVDKDNIGNNALETSTSIFVNNNVNEYEGNIYEKIMVNTYKALDFASLNDNTNARIEFNRALDRQRRAKDFFKNEIKQKKKELKKKNKQKTHNFDSIKAAQNKQTQDAIYKKYSSLLNDFDAYPDFVNPFTTYISGIYFMLDGDVQKARDLLKESVSMNPKNKQILSDFKLSDKYITSLKNAKENFVWVIFENGEGMVKDEIKIDIPLFLFNDNVLYTGISLPTIIQRQPSYKFLKVNGKKTVEICNMDNVIKTEFKKRFPLIVTQALLNTIVKTVVQKQLNDNAGLIGGIAGAIYQNLTNKADIRSWTALPKNFQSIRVINNGKPIVIKNDKAEIIKSITIPKGKNAMIYVKSQNPGNNKIHKIIF